MDIFQNNFRKRTLFVLIVLQLVCITCLSLYFFVYTKGNTEITVDLSRMSSSVMNYENGTWAIDKYEGNENILVALYGEKISLPKGSYTCDVEYLSENENLITPYSTDKPDSIIGSNYRLENCNRRISFDFELNDDVKDLEFRTFYTCSGRLEIKNISVYSNSNRYSRIVTMVVFIFIILDLLLIFFNQISQNKRVSFVLFISFLICSFPLIFKDILVGHDLPIHLLRIEGLVNELIKGNFPVRMQSMWFGGYGYPISIYYGDWSLYFPALLRIVGFSITDAWKIFVLNANLVTILVGYFCFNKIYKNKFIASLVTLAYTTATFRIIDIYVRSTAGEIVAFIFLPIIAMAIYGIYESDVKDKTYYKNAVYLAVGMTGILTTHILTTEIVTICLFVLCLILLRKTLRRQTIVCYLSAVGLTCLMSAAFLVPFFDYFFNVSVIVNDAGLIAITDNIQASGAYIWEYFDLFGSYIGGFGGNTHGMNMSLGLIGTFALVMGVFYCCKHMASKRIKLLIAMTVMILFVSSNLFPWNLLTQISCSVKAIQFPWRFLFVAVLLLSLLLGEILSSSNLKMSDKYKGILCLLFSLIIGVVFAYKYKTTDEKVRYFADTSVLSVQYVSGGEYIIQNTNLDDLIYEPIKENDEIVLPVFNYPYYEVTDNEGKKYEIKNGTNNRIAVCDYQGDIYELKAEFVEPVWWRVAEFVSFFTISIVAVYILRLRFSKHIDESVLNDKF